jgi:transposase
MRLHGNAALSLNQRRRLVRRIVEEGWSLTEAAAAAEVSERTARRWRDRYLAEGEAGLLDRSSAPRTVANRTAEERVEAIACLRRLRFTGAEIAELLSMPEKTVSGILTRIGLGRLGRLGMEPERRYERSWPGELIHVDVKKLGRIERGAGHRITGRRRGNPTRTDGSGVRRRQVGWDYVHVAIDDATRLAYAEVLPDEKAQTAVGFLRRALRFFRRHHGRACHDRQRVRLPLRAARLRLPGPRPPPPAHPPLPAPDQRQGRALHPHHAQRVGLRPHLPPLRRARHRPRRLAMAL